MSVQLAAIIGLLLIVVAATLRPVNAGAIALVGTFAVGTFVAGEDIRTLNSGFPVDLFVLVFGVTYLFGIASVNGPIQWVVSLPRISGRCPAAGLRPLTNRTQHGTRMAGRRITDSFPRHQGQLR
jgi:hypothetical protein